MAEAVTSEGPKGVEEVHILWISEGMSCDGDSVSITAAGQPGIEDVLLGAIPGLPKVNLHNTVLSPTLGGEEFLVLLPDTDAGAAQHVAEKLRAEVAGARAAVPVTVSIGVATWDGEAPEDLLQRADEALYEAKEAGRDRVMAATLHGRT